MIANTRNEYKPSKLKLKLRVKLFPPEKQLNMDLFPIQLFLPPTLSPKPQKDNIFKEVPLP